MAPDHSGRGKRASAAAFEEGSEDEQLTLEALLEKEQCRTRKAKCRYVRRSGAATFRRGRRSRRSLRHADIARCADAEAGDRLS